MSISLHGAESFTLSTLYIQMLTIFHHPASHSQLFILHTDAHTNTSGQKVSVNSGLKNLSWQVAVQ